MSELPLILSLAHQKRIDEVCKPLTNLELNHFVMYIIFNDQSTFVLSNVYSLLKPYYQEALYKEDYTYTPILLQNENSYYLCSKTEFISNRLRVLLNEKYSLYPIYNLIRRHIECTFVFSAIRNSPINKEQSFYDKTIKSFENFCIGFVDSFLDLIIQYNSNYRQSFILRNKVLRDKVIRYDYEMQPHFTLREQECLWLAAQGKSRKQIAQVLKISPFTVEQYLSFVRAKLKCKTLIEAVVEAVYRGIIGKVNLKSPFSLTQPSPLNCARPVILA